MTERIEGIKRLLKKSPDDVFLHYSLGMEYEAQERFKEAIAEFERCIELKENYLAAYVEAGKCLRSAGELSKAREIFATGMELAAKMGENHMRDFIQQQLDSISQTGDF